MLNCSRTISPSGLGRGSVSVLFCFVSLYGMGCHFAWHIRQAVNSFRLHSRLVCTLLRNTLCCQTLWLTGWLTWKEYMWLCMLGCWVITWNVETVRYRCFSVVFNSFDIPVEWKWRDTYMCVYEIKTRM